MRLIIVLTICACAGGFSGTSHAGAALLGGNNLGMHCMDSDYSVFSILPPYNTIEAQLVVNGKLATSASGYSVTYQAVADPDGSINSTTLGKGNFYDYTSFLYAPLAPDMGLAGWAMPGPQNLPQAMRFEALNSPAAGVSTPANWFRAEGIPIFPWDDAKRKNEYPLMRLVARDAANTVLAVSDIVLPVSDEMDCRVCHASDSQAAAKPAGGWVKDANPERDYRLNILRLHDEREFGQAPTLYSAALASKGFNAAGLYANVVNTGKPILCAACHLSEALQGSGLAGIPPLTRSMHASHAQVADPVLNVTLDNSANRAACYRCHPGSTTKCLRGAMGNAVAPDGSMEMQCQSCHGSMSQVGSPNRTGWFMEPNCQSCHTGTATHNNGQIRYASVFTDDIGTVRTAVDSTFATTPNTPATGLSLYRFSVGHGGLQCSACHGSTHAEFPASGRNDAIRNVQLQGHAGVTAECATCHTAVPTTTSGGPHGMHPIGQSWVSAHHDAIHSSADRAACAACHGADFRGTVLSRAMGPRTLTAQVEGGGVTLNLFQGAIIGCYTCHNGPNSESLNTASAPTAGNLSTVTRVGNPVTVTLPIGGANASARIISQPAHGTVGLNANVATYFPEAGFSGIDTFKFAAYDGAKNSSLATATFTVSGGGAAPVITAPPVSLSIATGGSATFSVTASGQTPLSYQWRFNGVNIGGATSSTFTISSVQAANAGTYDVVVTNPISFVTSSGAVLTVTALGALINGSFETDYTGWTATGNQSVFTSSSTFPASQGTKDVVFNAAQKTPSGVLSQTFATTAGRNYVLAFDLGAFSVVNQNAQRMQVTVQGSSTLLSRTLTVSAPGNGLRYAAQSLTFVADSASATLTFKDVSLVTDNVDLVLDNVRVTSQSTPPPPPAALVNGSFETDYTGWTASGNQSVFTSSSTFPASQGTKDVVFNAGQKTPNGAVSQTFATTAGQTYVLAFDLGAFSLVNQNAQRMQVTVQGSSTLLSQTLTVSAPGNSLRYAAQSLTFVADSASATLTFKDVSLVTDNVDLVLDNVRVTAQSTPPPPPAALVNGSFEGDYTGWTASGNQSVFTSSSTFPASQGSKDVVFNAGQKTPTGVLSQTFATTAGQSYVLAFDLGAFSLVNQNAQRMQVTVQGSSTLLSQTLTVLAPGNGLRYAAQSLTFVADSASATLTFKDVSLVTDNVDLVLDNVRLSLQSAAIASVLTPSRLATSSAALTSSIQRSSEGIVLRWEGLSGGNWHIEESDDLESWMPLEDEPEAQAGVVELKTVEPTKARAFYRISPRVSPPAQPAQ